MAIAAKGTKCEVCGYDRCMEALEFHHLSKSDKNFGLSEKGYSRSWKRVEKELKKCVLLCANCHLEIHAKVAAPDGNVRMKNRVNSGKPDSAGADMVILSQASSRRVG
jgi:predicted HNH restriction endonuclease